MEEDQEFADFLFWQARAGNFYVVAAAKRWNEMSENDKRWIHRKRLRTEAKETT